MLDLLITLRKQLEDAGERAIAMYQWGVGDDMRRERAVMERTFNAPGLAGVPEDAIRRSLEAVRRAGRAESFKDLKYACLGCTLRSAGDGWCLIEDARRFPRVLKQVDQQRDEPRRFRRCYQGLMSGYFEYAGGSTDNRAGRKNWQSLRAFLNDRLPLIRTASPTPEWTAVLAEHRGLFTDKPCVRYGAALLEGRRAEVDQLRNTLGITESSWFLTELVMAQIEAAAALGEARFAELLPTLLSAIESYETLLDRGLARLLEIYAGRQDRPERADLRDTAVGRWGNPWLERNRPSWGRVSAPARDMVSGWLKTRLIEDFFELLTDDGATDKRRLKYWLRYAERISDMWFALGNRAQWKARADPDFKKVAQRMEGRRLVLDAGGPATNNAFIMRIGDMVVVEFGATGNACYVFDARNLPFDLDRRSVRGDTGGLKHDAHRERLLHGTALGQSWEERFDAVIFRAIQWTPVAAPFRLTRARPPFSDVELQRLATAHGLRIDDHRPRDGALWVRTDDANSTINAMLRAWAFTYKRGKGWYRE